MGKYTGILVSANLECLDYFIRHIVIWSEMRLCIIKKEQTALCKVCKNKMKGCFICFYCVRNYFL